MKTSSVLEGIKVCDFTWWGVGPQVMRELAEHGAVVVRVESHRRPDGLRFMVPYKDGKPGIDRSAFGTAYNTNKLSISLDLTKPRGREIAHRLVKWADIVGENMAPGMVGKFDIDYKSCKRIKPDIIYFSTTAQGQYGPHCNLSLTGSQSIYLSGFGEMTGWPDRGPVWTNTSYTNYVSPWYVAIALIGALLHRQKTGKGTYIDQSQLEAGLSFIGPAVLDYTVNNKIASRKGNRSLYYVPHGGYQCLGTDRWCTITVRNDKEWQAFCDAIDRSDWIEDPRFTDCTKRKENEDILDPLIEAWTKKHPPEKVMQILQAAGVPAGVIQNAQDLFEDPQIKYREHFKILEHKEIGPHSYHSPAYRLSKTPSKLFKAGPTLGEDNEYVFKEILGFSDSDIEALLIDGVITTDSDLPDSGMLY